MKSGSPWTSTKSKSARTLSIMSGGALVRQAQPNVAERTEYTGASDGCSSRFEQTLRARSEGTPPEWKGFDHRWHRGLAARRQREAALSPAFLQFLVDRLASWADEFLELASRALTGVS